MTASEIITRFELQVDDATELSSSEELSLLNKIYQRVCADRAWQFLRKAFTGTQSTSVPYIALPSDFGYLTQNYNYTTNNYIAQGPVVFVGANYSPYQVVSYADRRTYRNQDGYAYIDIVNSRLYFTMQPTIANSVEFDYTSVPTALTLSDTPSIPTRFQDVLYHGMAVEDYVIQNSDKAKSYAPENQLKYTEYLQAMAFWDANLQQM